MTDQNDQHKAIDSARPIRDGEALDMAILEPYLREHIEDLGQNLTVQQFPSGHSNLTYLIDDGQRSYVLRRPPFGAQVKSGHDMGREFRMINALYPTWPKVPRPYLFCEDDSIIGAPFYLMERVVGVILRGDQPKHVELPEDTMSAVCDALVQTFVEIHQVDLEATGLDKVGRPEGYVQRQVDGWIKRYNKAKTDEIDSVAFLGKWLQENQPPSGPATLIHNDYKYDNLILNVDDLTDVKAVLDWEMATVGDPLMDLGTALGYWVEATDDPVLQMLKFGPTALPGNLTRAQLVTRYAELSGRDVSDALFYYVFGLFKICGIAQQIYYRFKHGYTKDPRFAGLIFAVNALGEAGKTAIDTGRISES